MITKEEIMQLLMKSRDELKSTLNNEVLNKLADEIMVHNNIRPLPSIDYIKKSPEFESFLQTVFQNLQMKQEKFESLSNLPAIKTQEQLSKEQLSNLQTKINTFIFRSASNRLFREDNHQGLQDLIKTTLEGMSLLNTSLLSAKDLSDLTKISLELYSKRYEDEMKDDDSSVHIIHFYESPESNQGSDSYIAQPRAAEYLQPYDSDNEQDDKLSFDKTSHGLGSGIYGVGKLTTEQINEQLDRKSQYQIVEISKPLRLNDDNPDMDNSESNLWTALSKDLQHICDEVKNKQQQSRKPTGKISRDDALTEVIKEREKLLKQRATELSQFKSIKLSSEATFQYIIDSLKEFLQDSKKSNAASEVVAMPINYLISKLGFTGVVSKTNDLFNRGLIATQLEGSYHNWRKIPVKNLVDPISSPTKSEVDPDPLLSPFVTSIESGAAGPLEQRSGTEQKRDDSSAEEFNQYKQKYKEEFGSYLSRESDSSQRVEGVESEKRNPQQKRPRERDVDSPVECDRYLKSSPGFFKKEEAEKTSTEAKSEEKGSSPNPIRSGDE
jgi:hypothetical protein